MLTLNDGRNELWQWDTNRKLTVDADCSQVHFSNKVFGRSIDVDVIEGTATIPDVLLQTDKELTAWAFAGTAENGYTKIEKTFKVNRRNKPADYVFTHPEQTTLGQIMKRLDRIEESQDPDAIKNAVDEYLANNPIQIDEKDPTVPDWAKQTTKPKYTATEVGAVAKVNGVKPDANGNVQITIPDSGGNADQSGCNKWRGKTLNFMGDSITEGYASTAKFTDIIASALYATCNNYGIGGSTIANGQNPMYSRVLQMDEDADLCVVFGGTNDFANYDRVLGEQFIVSERKRTLNLDTNTFYGGLNQLCTNLYSRFPYSTLVLCTPLNRQSFAGQETDMQANGNGLYLDEYVNAIKKVAAYFSIPCLDLYATVNLYPYDTANIAKYYSANDQLHPNAEGHKHIANVMLAFFDTLADKRGRTTEDDSDDSGDETEVTLTNISATYSGGNVEVGTAVSALTGIVVTAHYSNGTTATVTDYTLSGEISEGNNVITVTYGGKITTFTVIGVSEEADVIISSISATYSGGKVEEGVALTSLTGVTVIAHYSDGSEKTVTDYSLSGEIAVGENTIVVNYSGLTTTFVVIGVAIAGLYSATNTSGVLEVKNNFYYDTSGTPTNSNEHDSWKIPCKAGERFEQYSTTKYGMYKTFWDVNGGFIESITPPDGNPTYFTVPNNERITYMWTPVELLDIADGSYALIRCDSLQLTETIIAKNGYVIEAGELIAGEKNNWATESYMPVRAGNAYKVVIPDGYSASFVFFYDENYTYSSTLICASDNKELLIQPTESGYIRVATNNGPVVEQLEIEVYEIVAA